MARLNDRPASPAPDYDPSEPVADRSSAPWRIFNIGCERPVHLRDYIELIERWTDREAIKNMLTMQPGDVHSTCADASALSDAVRYRP